MAELTEGVQVFRSDFFQVFFLSSLCQSIVDGEPLTRNSLSVLIKQIKVCQHKPQGDVISEL